MGLREHRSLDLSSLQTSDRKPINASSTLARLSSRDLSGRVAIFVDEWWPREFAPRPSFRIIQVEAGLRGVEP